MCGIVGMAGNINHGHKAAFKDMLTVCQVRGKDSTGVIKVGVNDKFDYIKRACLPTDLFDLKAYDQKIDNGLCKALIGHTRAKTMGVVNSKNAHPFEHGHLCGVHNGTLKNAYNMEGWRDFDVDSDWLYWHAHRHGMDQTISKLDQDGAWALVWWDENEKTLNFLRNKERPLWFTHSKDLKTIFWASEIWMLGTVSRRFELWDGGEDQKVYYPLATDELYSFELDDRGNTPQDIFKLRPVEQIKGEVRGNQGNWSSNHGGTGVNSRGTGVVDFRRHNIGGKGASPFLNDKVDDIGRGVVLPRHSQGHTPRLVVSTHTPSGTEPSSNSSLKSGDSSTASKSSTNIERPKLSLPSTISKICQPEDKGSKSNVCNVITGTSPSQRRVTMLGPVSLRKISGIEYITDNKTQKEFSVGEFERETACTCTFCTKPIGDLSEVHEIFVKEGLTPASSKTTFLCKTCIVPHFNA